MRLNLDSIKSQNQMINIYIGSFLLSISILDVFLNSFFKINISGSLPGNVSTFFPLIIGFIGLVYLRMEIEVGQNLIKLNHSLSYQKNIKLP